MLKAVLVRILPAVAAITLTGIATDGWIGTALAGPEGLTTQSFVGKNDAGDSQAALEDALFQADAFYASLGADIRYVYRVVDTTGVRGGLLFLNDIRVTIITAADI